MCGNYVALEEMGLRACDSGFLGACGMQILGPHPGSSDPPKTGQEQVGLFLINADIVSLLIICSLFSGCLFYSISTPPYKMS